MDDYDGGMDDYDGWGNWGDAPWSLWEKDLDAYIMFQMESWPLEEIEAVVRWLG